MVTGRYSFKIKPMTARDNDYEMREYSNEVDSSEVEFPDHATARHKFLVLNYMAAESVFYFAVMDGAIPPEFCKEHLKQLRLNLREVLPDDIYELTGQRR